MISDEALKALGMVYSTYVRTSGDRLLACLCAIQLASGLRIVEILTLPVECLKVTSERIMMPSGRTEEREVTAIHRFKAKSKRKGGKGRPSFEPIYLTQSQASLARAAYEEVLRITRPYRERAKLIEESDGRCLLPRSSTGEEYLPFDEISRDDLATMLGFTDPKSVNAIPKTQLRRTKSPGGFRRRRCRSLPETPPAYHDRPEGHRER